MNNRTFFILILVSIVLGITHGQPDIEAIKKRLNKKKLNLDEIRKSQPVDNEKMTRLLRVDYTFQAETILYDDINRKEETASTIISGNFSFDTLHYDVDGGMLAKFELTQCNTNNCGEPKPVYVAFRQGGNNIDESFVVLEHENEAVEWNILFAIVNSIYTPAEYGEGDEQRVKTVYGWCKVHFTRPEDKRFRRTIDKCDLGYSRNYSRFNSMEDVSYSQDAWYTQNTKVDADIIMIDAIEMLTYRSPFHPKHGFQLESRNHVEITNRTRLFVERKCDQEISAMECAQKGYGATKVGNKIYEKVRFGVVNERTTLSDQINTYRTHLHDMGDSHICSKHSSIYSKIAQAARYATYDDWLSIIRHPENDHVLSLIANALGGVGTSESVKIAREVLLVESPDALDDFLFGVAHSSSNCDKWHKSLMYWLNESSNGNDYWKIANTVATVLKRRCNWSPSSQNSCAKGKEAIVNKFVNDLLKMSDDDDKKVMMLEVLSNLPVFRTYNTAQKYLCSSESKRVHLAALNVIYEASSVLYDSQLIHKLVNIFRNTCPRPSSTEESQLAIDILVRCIPDHQNVGTLILRSETNNPQDAEKWNYLYSAIAAHSDVDEMKKEFWDRMRRFRVFRPNYLQRALVADSNAHIIPIGSSNGYRISADIAAQFDNQIIKRSRIELSMRKRKTNVERNLMRIDVNTEDIDKFGSTNGHPSGAVRLGLLGHKLPTFELFKGFDSLLSTAWNADGQTIKLFEGHVPLRDSHEFYPLLSGLTVNVASNGAVSSRILTSAQVSMWDQNFDANLNISNSLSMSVTATLLQKSSMVRSISSAMSFVSLTSAGTDVDFSVKPFKFCTTINQQPKDFKQMTVIEHQGKPKKTITRRRHSNAFTYRLDNVITKYCNNYHR